MENSCISFFLAIIVSAGAPIMTTDMWELSIGPEIPCNEVGSGMQCCWQKLNPKVTVFDENQMAMSCRCVQWIHSTMGE